MDLSFFVALVPVATLLLMNLVPLVPKTRIRQLSESFSGLENQLSFAYRSIAAALGLLLIHRFAPTDSIIFVYAFVGVVLSLGPGRKLQREWFAWALVYAAFGLLPGLEELMREQAVWQSLSAILSLFVIQQFMRARQNGSSMPELGHQALILVGGASTIFWFSVKVSNLAQGPPCSVRWEREPAQHWEQLIGGVVGLPGEEISQTFNQLHCALPFHGTAQL